MENEKLIFASDLIKAIRDDLEIDGRAFARVKKHIEDAPAVEVVRCKDCKHYKPQERSAKWHATVSYCVRSASIKMPPDGFCSYGERREGE